MLNKQEFKKIKKELAKFETEREAEIQKSREIIRFSKLIIYALHRNSIKEAADYVKKIKNKVKALSKNNYDMSLSSVAKQEYVEALCYYHFIKDRKIPTKKELNIDTETYLLGICDLTGELVRKAVDDAIKRNFGNTIAIKELVSEIYRAFLDFDLRNGDLRKKADSIKYNLKKLEDLVYEIKTKRH
ncbi:hypothetical protein J4409_02200 [Candidatus Woesearchaeota archaeon]|nr:hypothetical protein [Candidatus Woesearchaeota archaeon]